MPCYAIDGVIPVVSPQAHVHPTAVLIGDVVIEAGVYIGPFAALRADFGGIRIQKNANVQDSCTIHGFPDSVTLVEEYGHIGHGAILHGCIIRKNVLVGMNSVILDEAEIGENTIIGANSTVKAKAKIPENSLALGSPAKVIRSLEAKEIAWKTKGTEQYIQLAERCLSSMYEVEPLSEDSADRLTYKEFNAAHVLKENS
ncbi:DapH/DapD/GlmU-related protein [Acinetobacter terrae]|jgi:phenylacetic acid degradation protein|uniref:Gamma carbonic anhydrase family protein n=1 Tax=Acinetobacter terrae TaxID=2731247 RepID=A0A241VAR6_9GAMM|nr:DapH/DapD/GlmU-related protein [Acinetobacter terrae]NNH78769.1 gamma carbonic anhydrase family protein [Acinetobacter terrae]OAL86687.1 gamma carbonic anhydrase family protein [Acinetobacter terrae]OTG72876.1 gamma carbonic anhydrase family protein [Acinetobacter terrae]